MGLGLIISCASDQKPEQADSVKVESQVIQSSEVETIKSLIQHGDSLFIWNDSSYFFDFLEFYDSSQVFHSAIVKSKLSGQQAPFDMDWISLQDVRYGQAYFEQIDMEVYVPLFPEELESLHGQLISIEGYVIPIDGDPSSLALSAGPFSACFFCGKGSPASVVSLYFDSPPSGYTVDDFVRFEGRLKLNPDNPEEFYYYMENCREVDSDGPNG